jgi:hypothetical protein
VHTLLQSMTTRSATKYPSEKDKVATDRGVTTLSTDGAGTAEGAGMAASWKADDCVRLAATRDADTSACAMCPSLQRNQSYDDIQA